MIDPETASEIAITGISICIKAGKLLKETIENIKHVKEDLLKLVSEIERYRNVLGLLKVMTRELLKTDYRDMELAIDTEQIQGNLRLLEKAAVNIAELMQKKSGQFLGGVAWTFKKTEAEKLAIRLREDQGQLMVVVGLINTTASLRSLQEFDDLKAKAATETAPVTSAFDGVTLAESPYEPAIRTWLGHIHTEVYSEDYILARKDLSDAAYHGEWKDLFELLELGRDRYQENWVNAVRIKPYYQRKSMSFWGPLHQAALWKAPVEVIQKLLDLGAFRTLRTEYSEYSYYDQTASEIATDQGYHELARLLAPVIKSPVPEKVLARVQRNFHELVRRDLGHRIEGEHLYLPVLEVLTELEGQALWFEVRKHEFKNAGYLFRLDGRDLLVRSRAIREADAVLDYRITAYKIQEVQDATLIHE